MSTIKVDAGFLSKYLKDGYKHEHYTKTVEMYNELQVHSDGIFPKKLIGERRPSESKILFDYREKIYQPQTKYAFSKINNSISKIRKSQDWLIRYPKETSKKIKQGETLQDYCEFNYPYFNSITNWMFKVGVKNYLIDSNALVCVYPLEIPKENEYVKPVTVIYNSDYVIDFVANDYAVVMSKEKTKFTENGAEYEGDIYLTFTTEEIWLSKQLNLKRDFKTELYYAHNLGILPVRQLQGEFKEYEDGYTLFQSRLTACLPSWNEAVREYSDMQASVCKHMFPTMVIHTNSKCNKCNGIGKTLQPEGKGLIECSDCKGKGSIPTSPYEDIEIRPAMANEQPLPNPVAYYIDKNTDIIKIQDERIDKHIYNGFAAVNFEFLYVGLNQSGVAKELDRSELNSFIYSIAEDIVDLLDDIYYYVNEYRYSVIIPDKKEREAQLPVIGVPEKYDIISETYLADEIAKAKTNKVNPFIVNALEVEYASKKFNSDPTVRDLVKMSLELDPLSGLTEDEKMVKLNNGVILKQDYIVSSYINHFIKRALQEIKDFQTLTYAEKLIALRKYADEIIAQTKPVVINGIER